MGTLLTGPQDPTHPLIFQRFAAPLTPSRAYSESEQIAMLPFRCVWSACSATISSAALLVCFMSLGTYDEREIPWSL